MHMCTLQCVAVHAELSSRVAQSSRATNLRLPELLTVTSCKRTSYFVEPQMLLCGETARQWPVTDTLSCARVWLSYVSRRATSVCSKQCVRCECVDLTIVLMPVAVAVGEANRPADRRMIGPDSAVRSICDLDETI